MATIQGSSEFSGKCDRCGRTIPEEDLIRHPGRWSEDGPMSFRVQHVCLDCWAKSQGVKSRPLETEEELRKKATLLLGFRYKGFAALLGGASLILFGLATGIWVYLEAFRYLSLLLGTLGIVAYLSIIVLSWYYRHLLSQKIEELRNPEPFADRTSRPNPVEQLTDINVEHLNKYYKQTYDQCDKSFSLTKTASNWGYGLMLGGFVLYLGLVVLGRAEESRLLLLGASTGAGIVVKLVSGLYFYLYSKTVTSLGAYHDKLYRVQNILLCLNFSGTIEDPIRRDEVRSDIIRMLLDADDKAPSSLGD